MIVSHRHRFVFVKTLKTAGSSLELALSSVCGPSDIITWLQPEDEVLRSPGPGPQNFRSSWPGTLRAGPAAIKKAVRKRRPPLRYRPHTSALDARALLGPDVWRGYLTFAVERDPFDRLVSLHFWSTRNQPVRQPLSEWLRTTDELSNFPLYGEAGRPIVDRVLRYERLTEELSAVAATLGVALPPLPRAKAGHRPPDADGRRLFSPADRALIERACHREIDLLGYAF